MLPSANRASAGADRRHRTGGNGACVDLQLLRSLAPFLWHQGGDGPDRVERGPPSRGRRLTLDPAGSDVVIPSHADRIRARLPGTAWRVLALLGLTTTVGLVGPTPALAVTTDLPPLAAPTAAPGVNSLTVSWTVPSGATGSLKYQVSSQLYTIVCTEIDVTSCLVTAINDATPWQFAVRYRGTAPGSVWSSWSDWSAVVPHVSILIVAGQSNAVGLGAPAVNAAGVNVATAMTAKAFGVVPIAWDQPVDAIPIRMGLTSAGPVPISTPQLRSWGSPAQVGAQYFGPELTTARRLYNHGQQHFVVLKVAVSGSTMVNGTAPPWNAPSGWLYQRLVNDTRHLQAKEAGLGVLATVGAVVFYQGEFDAVPGVAAQYGPALLTFLTDLHQDLGENANTPVVLVKEEMAYAYYAGLLTNQMTLDQWESLNQANDLVRAADDTAATTLPHVSTVESAGLDRISDLVHLSATGQIQLGLLIGSVLLQTGLT